MVSLLKTYRSASKTYRNDYGSYEAFIELIQTKTPAQFLVARFSLLRSF